VERGEALPSRLRGQLFQGMMGQPAWGFPEDLRGGAQGREPITCCRRAAAPVDWDTRAKKKVKGFDPKRGGDRSLISTR
jgi:pyruvate carboxylase